jgi:hypothetical protein
MKTLPVSALTANQLKLAKDSWFLAALERLDHEEWRCKLTGTASVRFGTQLIKIHSTDAKWDYVVRRNAPIVTCKKHTFHLSNNQY